MSPDVIFASTCLIALRWHPCSTDWFEHIFQRVIGAIYHNETRKMELVDLLNAMEVARLSLLAMGSSFYPCWVFSLFEMTFSSLHQHVTSVLGTECIISRTQ